MILLSHIVTNTLKCYKANTRNIKHCHIETTAKINRETILEIDSHTGTHIDYPAHCIKDGTYGETYPIDYLCSKKIEVLFFDLREHVRPIISLDAIQKSYLGNDSEILLIKTFFSHLRHEEKYSWNSPIIDSKIPVYLKQKFPNIKAVGFDVISVTSQLDKEEGKQCHHAFLSNHDSREILIIEDMDLSHIQNDVKIESITILPLLFEKMDGSPCTIIANIKEK